MFIPQSIYTTSSLPHLISGLYFSLYLIPSTIYTTVHSIYTTIMNTLKKRRKMSKQIINSFLAEKKKSKSTSSVAKENSMKTKTLPKRNMNSFLAERQKVVSCSHEIKLNYEYIGGTGFPPKRYSVALCPALKKNTSPFESSIALLQTSSTTLEYLTEES